MREYLASCYYIDSDDRRITELVQEVVGNETDPWRAALRIERWVNRNMRVDAAAPFVPASQVARSLRGDCRHYAILAAALCRAAGIPARTAVGLVQNGSTPSLGFHLWSEVNIDGQWRGLDATLGQGGVGVAHLKVADDSWQGVRSLTPFLPAQRVLGKLSVSVIEP
jgi:transglutaminase-like putative cysteine protease